jgi:hypothetical protein
MVTDDVLREAMVAGDTAVYVGWDPVEQNILLEFWESECVEFRMQSTTVIDKVIRTQQLWVTDPSPTIPNAVRQVTERRVYSMNPNALGFEECLMEVYWDQEEQPRTHEWLGVGRIPWKLLRCEARGLRQTRGSSLVTEQVVSAADRYDAVEQTAYLIARYNSHANLVVVGDQAELTAREGGRIHKDVADVLTFPGGTNAFPLALPTDATMIEHQRKVLADSIYQCFGLTRVDTETVTGLGAVSGYALEILNQKTEATFRRIRRVWRKDWLSLLNLVLDITAWKRVDTAITNAAGGRVDVYVWDETAGAMRLVPQVEDEFMLVGPTLRAFWTIDPDVVFPERKIEIQMGSGYVVDDVMVRDDFIAKLISHREALMLRGYSPTRAEEIIAEVADEAPPLPDFSAGALVGETGRSTVASSTKAGSTLSNTQRA